MTKSNVSEIQSRCYLYSGVESPAFSPSIFKYDMYLTSAMPNSSGRVMATILGERSLVPLSPWAIYISGFIWFIYKKSNIYSYVVLKEINASLSGAYLCKPQRLLYATVGPGTPTSTTVL